MARAAHLSFHPQQHRRPKTPARGSHGENGADASAAQEQAAPSAATRGVTARGKGRGARSNASGRYEKDQREETDDGWDLDDALAPLRTEITYENPRTIINAVNSPYVGFERSINPYRGCEHGCIYCFARPTHAYMGLSPGLDFETKLFAKPSAPKLLEKELSNKNYRPKVIAMGTNTDPYQPIERRLQIMRGILSVLSRFNHPVTILTKSQLITRDIDLLKPMAAKNLTRAMISITTRDKGLARSMEPRASAPKWRFEAIRKLAEAGIETGIMTGPMIPGLNDDEMETIMEEAAEAGASFSAYTMLRLPLEVSPLFQEWLECYAPNRARRVMRHIRDANGGEDYDPHWARGREIKSPYAQLLGKRNRAARARLGLESPRRPLDLTQFRVPETVSGQMDLFG